jgi:hypothetical protein
MSDKYCLHNIRAIDKQKKCHDLYIRFTLDDYKSGMRVDANTLKFENRERKIIRITNTYTFDNVQITAIWNNLIRLDTRSTVFGVMRMYPKLSAIWLSTNGKQINGSIPMDIISKMVEEINKIIGHKHILINEINIDQFEMLREQHIYSDPDLIFEKLLLYAATKRIASSEMIQYKREIPDDIEMIISVYSLKNQQNVEFGQDGGENNNLIKKKYFSF